MASAPIPAQAAADQAAMSLDLARRILAGRRHAEARASTAYRLAVAAGTRRDAQRHRWMAAQIAAGIAPHIAECRSYRAVPGALPRLDAVLFLAGA